MFAKWKEGLRAVLGVAAMIGGIAIATDALAVPSMARQTGYQCSKCHTGFPELTNFGRKFKLGGYAMTSDKWSDLSSLMERLPISGGVQVSRTSTNDLTAGGTTRADFPKDRKAVAQTAALYYGGRITANSGALVQYNYEGIEQKWGMEMFDVRWAKQMEFAGKETIFGITLNNNPTVSDIYNSTPAWGFPHTETAAEQMPFASQIDMTLASKVGGISVYGWWNDLVYAELASYRTARTGAFRPLGWGQEWNEEELEGSVVKGNAPYWRLALQQQWGPHTVEVGTYGMIAKVWQDINDRSLGTNRYRDIAYDARYQYLQGDHSASASTTFIKEKKDWSGAALAAGETSNASDTLKTLRVDFHYYFQRKWGGGLQYFRTTGNNNAIAYDTGDDLTESANGSPNARGWIPELNYFPVQNVKLALRYTKFQQFSGASTNYNGNGRNASDNDTIYLLGWFLF